MAEPSSPLNEDVNKCFSGLFESLEQNITSFYKLKQEIKKLKANLERGVATDINSSVAMHENITRIASPNIIKIGLWGDNGAPSFDVGQFVSFITKVKVYTGNVVNGLEITYVDDKENIVTYQGGTLEGESNEFQLQNNIEYIDSVSGFFKVYDGQTCISRLQFTTNLRNKYGPFGPGGGEKFTFRVVDRKIIGFYGQSDSYINSIGFYLGGIGSSVTMTFK